MLLRIFGTAFQALQAHHFVHNMTVVFGNPTCRSERERDSRQKPKRGFCGYLFPEIEANAEERIMQIRNASWYTTWFSSCRLDRWFVCETATADQQTELSAIMQTSTLSRFRVVLLATAFPLMLRADTRPAHRKTPRQHDGWSAQH